ncbi:MAG TPA: hypothetical protein VMY35_02525 [Phycisphaerae bacterium]|nr:hypothetical protein [Phycisphaerae bacterium]
MRRWSVFAICCLLPVACCLPAGCTTAAQRNFAAADVAAIGKYVEKAQPAIEAYCDALAAGGEANSEKAEQLRLDSRALAECLIANCQARLDSLRTEDQVVAAARTALDVAKAVLDVFEMEAAAPGKEADDGTGNPTTQP